MPSIKALFNLEGDNIEILSSPEEFYETLISNVNQAQKRIVLSSLYIGTGSKGEALVKRIGQRLREVPSLQVDLIFDFNRSMRVNQTSRTLSKFLDLEKVNCNLYHTSYLNYHKKVLAPKRWDEIFGVFHIKTYILDDICILSGANLSEEYFTNRQDRYIVIHDRKFCDYLQSLMKKVGEFCFRLKPDGKTTYPSRLPLPWKQPKNFRIESGKVLKDFEFESTCKVRGKSNTMFNLRAKK